MDAVCADALAAGDDGPAHDDTGGGDAEGGGGGGVGDGGESGESAGSARLLPVGVRMALLGRSALLELFRIHPFVRPTVIDTIIDRLIGRGPAAPNWVGALNELVAVQPLAVLEHTQRIKQLLEYVLALPPQTATAMLASLLPLHRHRPELRDHVVLLLRKAMFSREEPTRLTAVHGFLLLLHTTSGATGDGGDGGADDPTDAAGASESERVFLLELIGFTRRSLTQQAPIRAALYEGIVHAFVAQVRRRRASLGPSNPRAATRAPLPDLGAHRPDWGFALWRSPPPPPPVCVCVCVCAASPAQLDLRAAARSACRMH